MLSRRIWYAMGWLIALCGRTDAGQDTVPFVAAFERFARHQEIGQAVAGRLLISELSCAACHKNVSEQLQPKGGPRLDGAGNRLGREWMIRFLMNPQREKPGTTMPDVLSGLPDSDRRSAANSLAAFVTSMQKPFPEIKGSGAQGVPFEFWKHGDAMQGRQLYHQVGCVACHEADEDYETVETKPSPLDQLLKQLDDDELVELGLGAAARRVDSVPHSDLAAKYSPRSLTFFLLDPHQTRTTGRMPDLKLGVVEAADIAAWLLNKQVRDPTVSSDVGSSQEQQKLAGRRLFQELGCINCHAIDGMTAARKARALSDLAFTASRNCLNGAHEGLPKFELDEMQTAAIRTACSGESTGSSAEQAADASLELQLLKLNCMACHERNDQGGVGRYRRPYFETVGHVDIGDEGRLPPPLTGVGRKLKPAWLNQVLKGQGDVRPHMRIRMPIFPGDQVGDLPEWMAEADRLREKPRSEKEVFGDISGLADAGRHLLDTGCVQCHSLRGDALPGVVGIDLEGIASRVEPQWFHDFLLDPGSLKSRTRMPTFFPNGKSQNAAILNGDRERQIAAMWAYLKNVRRMKLPPKIELARSQNYELIPTDRPLLLRTFMHEAGTHAIAVGFPEKVHFAFDAEQVRLALAWRGRFLDAQGTWFVRFAPPAEPLGADLVQLPPGVPFALLDRSQSGKQSDHAEAESTRSFSSEGSNYQFQGYRLDKQGVPTFLYRFRRFDIEDRIVAKEDASLTRVLRITDRTPGEPSADLWFRGHFGKSLTHDGRFHYTSDTGVSVKVLKGLRHAGELEARQNEIQWIVPVEVEQTSTIEVQYSW